MAGPCQHLGRADGHGLRVRRCPGRHGGEGRENRKGARRLQGRASLQPPHRVGAPETVGNAGPSNGQGVAFTVSPCLALVLRCGRASFSARRAREGLARPSARARAKRAGVVGKVQVPKSPKGEGRGGGWGAEGQSEPFQGSHDRVGSDVSPTAWRGRGSPARSPVVQGRSIVKTEHRRRKRPFAFSKSHPRRQSPRASRF